MNTGHLNWEQDAVIQSLTKTFCQQFDEFKAEVKGLITKAQEEDKDLKNTLIAKVESLGDQLSKKDEEIKHLQLSLENAQLKTQFLEGRLTRVEKLVDQQHEDLLQEKARSMKNSLILNNIQETEKEDIHKVLHDFFKMELCMPEEEVKMVQIEKVHRLGKKKHSVKRPIVVRFSSLDDKNKVLKYSRNMDKSKKFFITTQLPPELHERKKQLWPYFKEAKEWKQKVKWVGEKLLLEDKLVNAKKDHIPRDAVDAGDIISTTRFKNTPPRTTLGNHFQGHITEIAKSEDVAAKLQVLYMDTRIARATHNIYAYRISGDTGIVEHYEDDGEWSAGRRVLKILKDLNIINKLVVISRWYGGTHIGLVRFQHIEEVTIEACTFNK